MDGCQPWTAFCAQETPAAAQVVCVPRSKWVLPDDARCLADPTQPECASYTYPDNSTRADIDRLCRSMPDMPGCSIRRECEKVRGGCGGAGRGKGGLFALWDGCVGVYTWCSTFAGKTAFGGVLSGSIGGWVWGRTEGVPREMAGERRGRGLGHAGSEHMVEGGGVGVQGVLMSDGEVSREQHPQGVRESAPGLWGNCKGPKNRGRGLGWRQGRGV